MTGALQVEEIHSFCGTGHIIQGLSKRISAGGIVTLLGRNGAAKSTIPRSITGLVTPRRGKITRNGLDMTGWPAQKSAQNRLALASGSRGVSHLPTVEENPRISQRKGSQWSLRDIYDIFSRLEERRKNGGGQMSDSEQQMLAITRALLCDTKLLMPVEALTPVIVDEIVAQVKKARDFGVPILLVEQKLAVCAELADRHYIIEPGRIVRESSATDFVRNAGIHDRNLGLGDWHRLALH